MAGNFNFYTLFVRSISNKSNPFNVFFSLFLKCLIPIFTKNEDIFFSAISFVKFAKLAKALSIINPTTPLRLFSYPPAHTYMLCIYKQYIKLVTAPILRPHKMKWVYPHYYFILLITECKSSLSFIPNVTYVPSLSPHAEESYEHTWYPKGMRFDTTGLASNLQPEFPCKYITSNLLY